ncbi:MAG: hypothetical protein IPI34_13760 [bacterium]|nr:hypothetical protein [bacterium]
MRRTTILTTISVLAVLTALWWLQGCGGDDPSGPGPDPEPQPVPTSQLAGTVAPPAGWTGDPASLRVVNGLAATACDAAGAFSLKVHTGLDQLALVQGPDGATVLMGWFGDGSTSLSLRSTAEVLAWLSLGSWMVPGDGAEAIRALLADPAVDLSGVEAAWAAMLAATPGGLAVPDQGLHDALLALTSSLVPEPGKGVIIAPGAQQSGVEVLNEGGINRITIKNSYRRRAAGFVMELGWRDTNDVEHELPDPLVVHELEVPPVAAFGGTINTIVGALTGGFAYAPESLDPILLETRGDAKRTYYRVDVLGMGLEEPDDPELYTSYELAQGEWMTMKCLVMDYFIPMFLNTAGAAGTYADNVFGDDIPGQVNDFVGLVTGALPNFHALATEGQFWPALLELWNAALTNGTLQGWVRDFIADGLQGARFTADESAEVMDGVERAFFLIGIADIVGNLADNTITGYQFGLCKKAESWDVTVTSPLIHVEPRGARIMVHGTQLLTLVVDDDTGGNPEGWAYAYRWRCPGARGTLVNPQAPTDTSNDFFTSSAFVQYVADDGSEGLETVTCELYVTLGGERTLVRAATSTLEVVRRHIVLPDTVFSCPRGQFRLSPTLDPPFTGDGTLLWHWRGGGANGTLRGPGNVSPPWTSATPWADFLVDNDGGNDLVTCVARLDLGGGVVSPVDSVDVVIRTPVLPQIAGQTYCVESSGGVDPNCWAGYRISVRWTAVPGITRYRVQGSGFNDPWYYGTSFDTTVLEGSCEHEDGDLLLGLTWGSGSTDCGVHPESVSCGANIWRFAGAVWVVTPVCP